MSLLEKLENESLRDFYFIATALILAFGVLQTTGTVLDTEKPVVSVVSCSMYPQLNVGDVLIVNGQEYEDINENDVIVYGVKEANVSIDGEIYHIRGYGDRTYDTPAGEMELLEVRTDDSSSRNEPVEAVFRIDDQVRVLDSDLEEINGAMVEVEDLKGMEIPVVHRVVEKNDDYLQTRGDNNQEQLEFEKRVRPDQIHGKVLFPIPRIGGLKILLMDLVGFNGDRPLVIDQYPTCQVRV